MARCLNCIHCDVCDSDRSDRERSYGDCSDFLHDDDVVPKSEVAREIFEEIEREIKNHGICYAQRKIAELKKKYTEAENDR